MSLRPENRPLSARTFERAHAALARSYAEALSMPGNLLPPGCVDELFECALAIVEEVRARGELAPERAPWTGDRAAHTIATTVTGLAVGARVLEAGHELAELGIGLFLRDMGKLALPPRLVAKRGPLAPGEMELLEQHPLLGLEFVREHQAGEGARSVVRSHHERWDGGGYPDMLAGPAIPPYARIAALADAFAGPNGVDAVRAGAGSAFDPRLSAVLGELVGPRRLVAA